MIGKFICLGRIGDSLCFFPLSVHCSFDLFSNMFSAVFSITSVLFLFCVSSIC